MTQAKSKLVYDRKGSGETVVLIHGIGHRRQAWGPVFDQLSEKYDVIALDLAGFGESPAYAKGTPYTMENACADLVANFEDWGISSPHLVGNSLGGAIALELGARGHASSVTALSPAGFFGTFDRAHPLGLLSVMQTAARFLPNPVLRLVAMTRFGRVLIGAPLYARPSLKSAEETYGDAVAMGRCSSAFWRTVKSGLTYRFEAEVTVPATVAWGTKDKILLYRQSTTAASRLPNAVHVPLQGAGHVPMTDEPTAIVELVEETVARVAAASAA